MATTEDEDRLLELIVGEALAREAGAPPSATARFAAECRAEIKARKRVDAEFLDTELSRLLFGSER